jgi:prepilin-type N-terminal cleavage/methylation domain-containing protein
MMVKRGFRGLGSHQFGFTLIELVVAMAVGSLIATAASATIYQVLTNNSRNSAHLIAVTQAENAIHFLLRDAQMAQTVRTDNLTGDRILELTWVDWDGVTNGATYDWSQGKLTRNRSREAMSTTVAYFVYPKPTFSRGADGEVVVTITTVVQGSSESRTVYINPRPAS